MLSGSSDSISSTISQASMEPVDTYDEIFLVGKCGRIENVGKVSSIYADRKFKEVVAGVTLKFELHGIRPVKWRKDSPLPQNGDSGGYHYVYHEGQPRVVGIHHGSDRMNFESFMTELYMVRCGLEYIAASLKLATLSSMTSEFL